MTLNHIFATGTLIAFECLKGAVMSRLTGLRVVRAAGVISSVALLGMFLALKDISHGEADVSLEWHMVEISLVIILVFHVLALRMLYRLHKSERIT